MTNESDLTLQPRPRRRRRWLLGGIAVAAVAAIGIGIAVAGSQADPRESETSSEPVRGGTLRFATGIALDSLDPSRSASNVWISANLVDSLVYQNADFSFSPWLAASWEVSEDGRDYTFVLRDDVTFSDGTPLDAAAVKYNFDRIVDPETASVYAASLLSGYEETVIVDEHTVTVRLAEPLTSFLQGLSLPYLGIQSPTYLEAAGADTAATIVGSGPFVLAESTPGQSWTLENREDYAWAPASNDHGAAYFDTVEISYVPEPTVRVNGAIAGDFDLVNNVTYSQYDAVRSATDVTLVEGEGGGITNSIGLNLESAVLSDQRVRNAFQRSFDVDTLIDSTFYGVVASTGGAFTPSSLYYDPAPAESYGYDPDEAIELLEQAGWTEVNSEGIRMKDGQALTLTLQSYPAPSQDVLNLVQALQQAALGVGWDLQYEQQDFAAWSAAVNAGDYDLQIHNYLRADPDIARSVWSQASIPPYGYNFSRPSDEVFEDLLQAGARTPDGDDREEIYHEIQAYVIDKGWELPLYPNTRAYVLRANIDGVTFNGSAVPYLYDLWSAATS